jgi:hypothetical protein
MKNVSPNIERPFEHRACNPQAILQCTLATVPSSGRGSSPEHGAIEVVGLRR